MGTEGTPGAVAAAASCRNAPCPRPGSGVCAWGAWSPCSRSCGTGLATREAACPCPTPGPACNHSHGHGTRREVEACYLRPCPGRVPGRPGSGGSAGSLPAITPSPACPQLPAPGAPGAPGPPAPAGLRGSTGTGTGWAPPAAWGWTGRAVPATSRGARVSDGAARTPCLHPLPAPCPSLCRTGVPLPFPAPCLHPAHPARSIWGVLAHPERSLPSPCPSCELPACSCPSHACLPVPGAPARPHGGLPACRVGCLPAPARPKHCPWRGAPA